MLSICNIEEKGSMMREQLQQRLETLKFEFDTGQTKLREMERQQSMLRETLLRISGAIQVLEEALAETESEDVIVDTALQSDIVNDSVST